MLSRRRFTSTLPLGLACGPAARAWAGTDPLRIGYLGLAVPRQLPHTFLEPPPQDEGIQGARLGLADIATTGRFTGQGFELHERVVATAAAAAEAFRELTAAGLRFVLADLPAALLLQLSDQASGTEVVLLNLGAADDALRNEACRRNLLHLLPSRAMLADALAQYLAAKRWRNVMLAVGPAPGDQLYAAAMRRALRKFGLRLVADRAWTFEPGARRTDTGHLSIAAEAARFTQGLPAHDVLVVADEAGDWGDDLAFRTTDPRPVAGTQGVVPTLWARPHEQWGATQLQRRFRARAGRWMLPRDQAAWLAIRALGEAATRAGTTAPEAVARATARPGPRVRRVQGRTAVVPELGRAAAPAGAAGRRPVAGLGLAAAGLPASGLGTRHARHRPAGDDMPIPLMLRAALLLALLLALLAPAAAAETILRLEREGQQITAIDGATLRSFEHPGRAAAARHRPQPGRRQSMSAPADDDRVRDVRHRHLRVVRHLP